MTTSTSHSVRVFTAASLALATAIGTVGAVGGAGRAMAATTPGLRWATVVNNADLVPGSTKTYNSFNAPSVNDAGLVVFRGQAKGEQQPARGVYTRDASTPGAPIVPIATVGGAVPQPNNSGATFNEFPSFPRIGATGTAVVTRGQSDPVWTYQVDGTDTKIGTSGVYTDAGGTLTTGASLLGAVPGYGKFAVPGAPAGTRFDQFPSSPSIDGTTIVFKGNYTEGTTGRTGDYFRDAAAPGAAIQRIADTSTRIPNQPAGGTATFGATAPPSAAGGRAVFTGWDNEAAPALGGIYLADLAPDPALRTLVGIGDPVPVDAGSSGTFSNFGEGLSFDGRYVAFWGTWGSETRTVTLICPTEGNADRRVYCNEQYPNGFTTTVPTHQGLFVYDTATGQIHTVVVTGPRFADFLFWNFSGHVPGSTGVEDGTMEPARWRSAAFVAVTSRPGGFQVAFKASTDDSTSGIYVSQGVRTDAGIATILDTSTPGTALDPDAPSGALVSSVGIERDGFRGRWLVINAAMTNPETAAAWSGIYATQVPDDFPDTTAPTVTVVPGGTLGSSASFTLSADEQGVSFECQLTIDGVAGAWQACTSPVSFSGLQPGSYVFSVRGTDKAGNVSAVVSRSWTVVAPVSVVSFASAGSAVAEDVGTAWLKVTRTNPARAASVQYARVGGTARPGSDFVLVSGTLRFAAGHATASIPVKVVNDSVTEPAETVVVQLSRPGAGTALGTRRTWTQLTIRASDQRPDAMISTQSVYGYLGSYYYTSTGGGQVEVVSARAGQASYFYVRVYNRGDVTNTFVLRGSVPGGNASVRYYLRPAYLPWSSDVTSAMLSKAGLKLTLRPGGYAQFLVRINLGARATIGSTPSAVVNAQWFGDGWRTDLVRATVRVIR